MMCSFIGRKIIFRRFVDFLTFRSSWSWIMMMWMVFNLMVFEFTVILKCQSVSFGMFSFWMNKLQFMVVGTDFNWMFEVFLIFFLNINWYSMIVDELDRLMWLCMFMFYMWMMFSLRCFSFTAMMIIMNDSSNCDGDKCSKNLDLEWILC